MNSKSKKYVQVAVTLPVKGTFTYSLPAELDTRVQAGCRVLVPFNRRRVTGYVLEKTSFKDDNHRDLKDILEAPDQEPLFHQPMVPFLKWLAGYYVHPLGQVIQSALPAGLNISSFRTAELTAEGRQALGRLPRNSRRRAVLSWIRDNPGRQPPWPSEKIRPLQEKKWIELCVQMRKAGAGPLMRKFVKLRQDAGPNLVRAVRQSRQEDGPGNEPEFLESFSDRGPILSSELAKRFSNGNYLIEKWIKEGLLEIDWKPVFRNPAGEIICPPPVPAVLFEQQRRALKQVRRFLDKKAFAAFLLYGITGSGKTELYYSSALYALDSGRRTIIMVPEISLAVYMHGLFRARLGKRVGIYHSGLSRGQRYDQWMRMVRGEVDLVIGARSALFAPLPGLGMIIVDEEHDSSYKQEAGLRHQARDAAVMRAKMENALVILGSGTPSVQSFQNSLNGRYRLLRMPERVERRPLPDIATVDMKNLEKNGSGNQMLSPQLRNALQENLAGRRQSILFLNRRGFHRLFICRSCGDTLRCPNCEVSLTYHQAQDRLTCHYCGFYSRPQTNCPRCGRAELKPYGFGTEKLENELKAHFPSARIARMDTDVTRKEKQPLQILKRFSEHELDLLVGTQMITKGYDFPKVTLVGVIAADLSLDFPDFRAAERTFQLLSQVAGRAGRGDQQGRVIIQTFNPGHYAIRSATAHDYHGFFEKESSLRKQLGYPPFSSLACLRLKGNSKERTAEAVQRLGADMRAVLSGWPKKGQDIQVLGPVEAPIPKLKGKYRWQILVRSRNIPVLKYFLTHIEQQARKTLRSSGVQLVLDVDPYQMN